MCCKPCSGTGVVWMNMKHREVRVPPDHEKGNHFKAVPCAYFLPLSYYTRVLEKSRKTKARRVARRIDVERKVMGSNPTRGLCLFHLNLAIIVVVSTCLFCARWNLIIVCVRDVHDWCLLYFHFRKI